jgi:hypothetical protein
LCHWRGELPIIDGEEQLKRLAAEVNDIFERQAKSMTATVAAAVCYDGRFDKLPEKGEEKKIENGRDGGAG